jgi:hypothetical protein
MEVIVGKDCVSLHVSGNDTRMWAMQPGCGWPCSTLSGRGFTAQFDSDGLCDFDIGESDKEDNNYENVDGHELSAICCDLLKNRIPESHPTYDVTVGQFLKQ